MNQIKDFQPGTTVEQLIEYLRTLPGDTTVSVHAMRGFQARYLTYEQTERGGSREGNQVVFVGGLP